MKKVVDVNFFSDPELEGFFRKSEKNIAVITSISAAEAYRTGEPADVLNLFKTFSKFPDQVIFLKHTDKVICLKPNLKNMQRRMLDDMATEGFRRFAKDFYLLQKRPNSVYSSVSRLRAEADFLMKKTASEMDGIASSLKNYSLSFTTNQLEIIRRDQQYTAELGWKIVSEIFALSKNLYDRENPWKDLLDYRNIKNTYQFRLSLCSYLLVLRWLKEGKTHAGKLEKVRNDVIDVTYVAFATFFDGLLSRDAKMNEIHEQARYMLSHVLIY